MDLSRSKTKELNDNFNINVMKKSERIEKLNRRREINARYSRLLLSKTIQHFQNQGHVTIRFSEKLNENKNGHLEHKKKQNSQFKQRTMSFWQLPETLKCEFRNENNTSRGVKNVTTQTNFPRSNEENGNSLYQTEPTNESFDKNSSMSSEILSSKLSCEGNIMSLVMRYGDDLNDQNEITQTFRKNQSSNNISSSHTPRRKYKSWRNAERSRNFWAAYSNFILCNRSIELRITKLFCLQNVQYIVAFSENFFENSNDLRAVSLLKKKSRVTSEKCYLVQFIKFNIGACACIFEYCYVEHVIDELIILEYKVDNTDTIQESEFGGCDFIESVFEPIKLPITGDVNMRFHVRGNEIFASSGCERELHKNHSANSSALSNIKTIYPINEAEGKDNDLRKVGFPLNRHETVAMNISCVVVSGLVLYAFLIYVNYVFVIQ